MLTARIKHNSTLRKLERAVVQTFDIAPLESDQVLALKVLGGRRLVVALGDRSVAAYPIFKDNRYAELRVAKRSNAMVSYLPPPR